MRAYWSHRELLTANEILRMLDLRAKYLSEMLEETTMRPAEATAAQALACAPEFVLSQGAKLHMKRRFSRVLARLINAGLVEKHTFGVSRRVAYGKTVSGRLVLRMVHAAVSEERKAEK